MIRNLRWTEEAEAELDQAMAWYEQRQRGLGGRLMRELRPLLERIQITPDLYPLVHGTARQAILRKFPFSVIYQAGESEILIVAVFHTSRDDAGWRQRVDPSL